ncbi:plac8 family [Fusarium albosuccineum]|uniref:Plac8 family n=1 Tax=Fusarium albosuccineum TaxID=1237068 RepID=A0A8H4LQJ6_9HYPO|nr:plac8 family [Fusarium albosuccineum]
MLGIFAVVDALCLARSLSAPELKSALDRSRGADWPVERGLPNSRRWLAARSLGYASTPRRLTSFGLVNLGRWGRSRTAEDCSRLTRRGLAVCQRETPLITLSLVSPRTLVEVVAEPPGYPMHSFPSPMDGWTFVRVFRLVQVAQPVRRSMPVPSLMQWRGDLCDPSRPRGVSRLEFDSAGDPAVSSYSMMKRGEIRERFGIQGSGMGDCCVSYWCLCCALIQQDNEVKARLSQGPITQGYQPQKEGMHMPNSPAPQQSQQQAPYQPGVQPGYQSPQGYQSPPPQGSFPTPQQTYNPHQPQPQY